jgi:hypothetical protein
MPRKDLALQLSSTQASLTEESMDPPHKAEDVGFGAEDAEFD